MKKNELPLDKFEIKTDFPAYQMSDEEKQKSDFVSTRFQDMQAARTIVDRDWDIYQTMIEAIREPYPDERSSSEVPLASALIEYFVADAIKLQTEYKFKGATSKHDTAAKALEHVWKYDWVKNNRKKEMVNNEYVVGGFGTAIIYTGYESYKTSQMDPIIGDDMTITWKEKTFNNQEIILSNFDIRQFWVDDQAVDDISQANDCFARQWIGYEEFKMLESSPVYKNIEYVAPREYSTEYKTFTTREERTKQGNFVLLEHYWNLKRDIYIQRANGIIVREHPIMSTIDGKKALPFVIRVLGKKIFSIYGRGFCEALMTFNSDINNFRELCMDAIRRSNSQVLAIGNGLTFNGRDFSYDNEILTFDGNLGNNFQQISGNPPNQAIFEYLDRLYKDIAIYVGIDIQNILGEASQTAFQTEVQREASQKRINVWLMNRDLAFERLANLHKDNLQRFFPLKDADGKLPELELDGEELITEDVTEKDDKGNDITVQKQRFRKKKGAKTMVTITPELLRGSIDCDVSTNATAPTINAVDREQKMDFLTRAPMIAQSYAQTKQMGFDLNTILPMDATMKDIAEDYNLTTTASDDQEDVKAMKDELTQQLQGMLAGTQGTPPTPPEQAQAGAPQAQGQPTPPQGQAMGGSSIPQPAMGGTGGAPAVNAPAMPRSKNAI